MSASTTSGTERTDSALAYLDAQLGTLPDESEEPRPAERDRIIVRRSALISHRGTLTSALNQCNALASKLQTWRYWHDVLKTAVAEMEQQLHDLEELPKTEYRINHRVNEVKETLRILTHGPATVDGETQTPLLTSWFEGHGVHPTNGRFFDGRGGLRSTGARVTELEKKYDLARAEVDRLTQDVERLMPGVKP